MNDGHENKNNVTQEQESSYHYQQSDFWSLLLGVGCYILTTIVVVVGTQAGMLTI